MNASPVHPDDGDVGNYLTPYDVINQKPIIRISPSALILSSVESRREIQGSEMINVNTLFTLFLNFL
jgi:hypothetical protein